MNKSLALGIAILVFSLVTEASWISPKPPATVGQVKTLADLSSIVDEQGAVLLSLNANSEPAKAVALSNLETASKSVSGRWKSAIVDQPLVEVMTDLSTAKNVIGPPPVPEAGTWAAIGFIATMTIVHWVKNRESR